MQYNTVIVQGIQLVLWGVAIALLACMAVAPFLSIDRNYDISFSLSAHRAVATLQSPAIASALINSVTLSVIASLFAIVCGGVVTKMLSTRSMWIVLGIIAAYSINPVARALSYLDLFQTYTPVYVVSSVLFGAKFSSTILLPALILGVHYLPIYLMRSLFVVGHTERDVQKYPALMNIMFAQVPSWVKGFPVSFALFFLLTFFDYWVIQVISGNTILYWTPLFVQKALASRAVNEAALMIDIGLVVTVLAYITAVIFRFIVQSFWRTIRPLYFMTDKVRVKGAQYGRKMLYALVGLFVFWPWISAVVRIAQFEGSYEDIVLTQGASRAIGTMVLLGGAVAGISVVAGLIFSAIFQTNPKRYRWWLPSAYMLALVPEAAYVLLSLFTTGSGVLRGNILWLFFLMVSFSIPMAFFVWESIWGERDRLKIWMLGSAMKGEMQQGTYFALREWRKHAMLVFLLMFWLTIDNVFITDFAAGPKWKPLSAVIFNATKRGFSDSEFFTTVLSAVVVSVCILAGLFFVRERKGVEA